MFIACSTYNRPALTRLCLAQQVEAAKGVGRFHVWDDASDDSPDFDGLDLASLTRLDRNIGPHRMRVLQIGAFLESDEEVLYLTDSDALLDPEALDKGLSLLESEPYYPVVSLYNSPLHREYTIGSGVSIQGELAVVRMFAPGISVMVHRRSLEPVAHAIPEALSREWDFALPRLLGRPCLVTLRSYVEHMGAGGIHSEPDDWDRDRAVNPTRYLADKRAGILSSLSGCRQTVSGGPPGGD